MEEEFRTGFLSVPRLCVQISPTLSRFSHTRFTIVVLLQAIGFPKEYIASATVPIIFIFLYILGGGMSLIWYDVAGRRSFPPPSLLGASFFSFNKANAHPTFFSCFSPCSNLAGFVYPSYMSFKAIESTNKRDDTQW